jgi:hypothetical protein
MNARRLAAALFVIAAIVYGGLALPARRSAVAAGDEYRRARDRRREALTRLNQLERREAARRRAAAAFAGNSASPAPGPGGLLVAVRRSVLASVEGSGTSNVHLVVGQGRPPVAATLQLAAEGPFAEAVRLAGHVARPGMGIALQTVRFSPGATGVLLELNGLRLQGDR